MSASSVFGINFNTTLLPLLCGIIAAATLCGVTTGQLISYLRKGHQDRVSFKTMICALWVLDVVHLAICSRLVYHYLVTEHANVIGLIFTNWSDVGQVALTSTSDLIVRSTFTHKIWLLSGRNMSLGAIAMAASLLPFSFGIAFSRKAAEAKYFTELPNLSWLLYSCLSVTVVADVVVATALCLLLWRQRTGFRKTDSLIAAIMRYSVETSLLTCTCAVACLVTYATMPKDFVYMGIYFMMSKLYVNALLAYLNARTGWRVSSAGERSVHPPIMRPSLSATETQTLS